MQCQRTSYHHITISPYHHITMPGSGFVACVESRLAARGTVGVAEEPLESRLYEEQARES